MRAWGAALLLAILIASVLTAWVPERWPASIIEVGSFALALVWMAKLAVTGKRPRFDAVMAPVAFIVLWGAVQMTCRWTVAGAETARAILGWGANLAILFAAVQTFDDTRVRERFLRGLLWFGFGIGVLATVQIFTSNGKVFWLFRITDPTFTMGPFVYHNHYAAFIEALLPLALIAALEQRDKRLWYSFASAAMIASVILSASRSGFAIVLVEAAAVIALFEWKKRSGWRRLIPAMAVLLSTTAVLTAMAGGDALARRLRERDYFDRLQMLHSSWDMFRDHAWTGVGLGNWPTAFPYYARYDDGRFANQAHNDWAQAAAEGGIATLAAFALLFALTVRAAVRQVWCVGLVFVFVHALIDYPFHKPQVAALVFAMLGAAVSVGRGRETARCLDG